MILYLIVILSNPLLEFSLSAIYPAIIQYYSNPRMRFLDADKDAHLKKRKKSAKETKGEDQSVYYNVLAPNCKVQCDSCEKDLTKYTRISASGQDYCVACFSNLETYPDHYSVVNKLSFPIFDADWSAEQELLLMEGLERHGFGNWNEISEQIGTDKTPADVEKHYEDVFMQSPNFIPTDREIMTQRDNKTMMLTGSKTTKNDSRKGKRAKDEANSFNLGNSAQRGSIVPNGPTANQTLLNTGSAGDIVGFMPKRGDFEVEYDNQAELLLAQMQFNDDDTEQEMEMKFKILEIYNHRLSQRIKRKEFVITRQLLDVKLQSQLQKNRGKEEREIYNAMKVFARFNTPEQHQKLIDGIIKQKQIRQRIEELRHYKKMGLKTLADVEQHLEEKRRKQEKNKKAQKPGEISYLFDKNINKNTARRTRGNLPEGNPSEKNTSGLPAQESKLCEDVGMTPSQYIVIKETLIRESLKNGFISKDGYDNVFKVEKQKIEGVFDFLVRSGVVLSK